MGITVELSTSITRKQMINIKYKSSKTTKKIQSIHNETSLLPQNMKTNDTDVRKIFKRLSNPEIVNIQKVITLDGIDADVLLT